jgi:hypothetical protein
MSDDPYELNDHPPYLHEDITFCAARNAARADADFRALCAGYLASAEPESRDLLGLMADRLIDLGLGPNAASEVLIEIELSHPDTEIPF